MNAGHTNTHDRTGLNMIELLVAMVVLSLVVTMMAAIFRHSETAWTQGTGETEVETAGRVALSMLTRDLQGAVADSNRTFIIRDDLTNPSYGLVNSELAFFALQETPTVDNRATRDITYSVREMTNSAPRGRYELIRACRPMIVTGATNGYSYGVVARNVSGFILTPDPTDPHRLPPWVDIYLEVMGERDALQAAAISDNRDFVEKKTKRFTTRVYFPNRNGYEPR